jgi:hypothetical protein
MASAPAKDLINNPKVLYVGVGGGMELLQHFSHKRRRWFDVVDEMLEASRQNLKYRRTKRLVQSEFVELKGDALNLPENETIAAQKIVQYFLRRRI